MSVLQWFTSWIIMILLIIFMARTAWGKTIVYYLLWLALVLLLVLHADELSSLINPEAFNLNG